MSEGQLDNDTISPEEEARLQKIAYRRNGFKIPIGIFLLGNILLWIIWFFVFKGNSKVNFQENKFFTAPFFVTIMWFIFFMGHYLIVYKWNQTCTEKC